MVQVRVAARRPVGLALGVVGVVLAATACRPTPPPPPPPQPVAQYCAAHAPTTPGDYQAAFDGLRNTYTEWASADGADPISLPDGRTVFLFGDTYVGHVDAGGAIDGSDPLIHNSFVVQSGACFAPMMGGAPLSRTSLIPGPGNTWYWPASGVVENQTLLVFLWHVEPASGAPGLSFAVTDMRVATFALPSLALESVQPLPFPTSSMRPYGATALAAPDGYVYLYGRDNNRDVYVARAPLSQYSTPSAWQFWGGPGPPTWQPDPSQAVPMQWNNMPYILSQLGTGAGPSAEPWVLPYKGEYLATAKSADVFSNDVSVFTGPSPQGPWTWQKFVAVTPPSASSGVASSSLLVAYGAYTLSPTSNPVIEYSTNGNPFAPEPSPLTISDYGPHFVAPDRQPPVAQRAGRVVGQARSRSL